MEKEFKKIDIHTDYWIPTIMKVNNGFILSVKTPRSDLDIIDCYAFKTLDEVFKYIKDLFE